MCLGFLQNKHVKFVFSCEVVASVLAQMFLCLVPLNLSELSDSTCFSDCSDVTGLHAIFSSLVKNDTNWLKVGNLLVSSSISTILRFQLTVSQSGNLDRIFLFSLQSFKISHDLIWTMAALQLCWKSAKSLSSVLSFDVILGQTCSLSL